MWDRDDDDVFSGKKGDCVLRGVLQQRNLVGANLCVRPGLFLFDYLDWSTSSLFAVSNKMCMASARFSFSILIHCGVLS